jgi:hypothetical protein
MSKHGVLGFKPQLRLEWRGQDGQIETEQPDHSASLGDSITSSTRTGFSVHTATHAGIVNDRRSARESMLAACSRASKAGGSPTQVGAGAVCGNRGVSTRMRSLAGEPIYDLDERERRWSAADYLQPRQIVSLRFSFSSSA